MEARRQADWTTMNRLEKLAAPEAFARALVSRDVYPLPASIRRWVLRADLRIPGV